MASTAKHYCVIHDRQWGGPECPDCHTARFWSMGYTDFGCGNGFDTLPEAGVVAQQAYLEGWNTAEKISTGGGR